MFVQWIGFKDNLDFHKENPWCPVKIFLETNPFCLRPVLLHLLQQAKQPHTGRRLDRNFPGPETIQNVFWSAKGTPHGQMGWLSAEMIFLWCPNQCRSVHNNQSSEYTAINGNKSWRNHFNQSSSIPRPMSTKLYLLPQWTWSNGPLSVVKVCTPCYVQVQISINIPCPLPTTLVFR